MIFFTGLRVEIVLPDLWRVEIETVQIPRNVIPSIIVKSVVSPIVFVFVIHPNNRVSVWRIRFIQNGNVLVPDSKRRHLQLRNRRQIRMYNDTAGVGIFGKRL